MSDHMLICEHDPVKGWGTPEIKPYGPLTLEPTANILQYGGNAFEGMKVRRDVLHTHVNVDLSTDESSIRHTLVPIVYRVSFVSRSIWKGSPVPHSERRYQ